MNILGLICQLIGIKTLRLTELLWWLQNLGKPLWLAGINLIGQCIGMPNWGVGGVVFGGGII